MKQIIKFMIISIISLTILILITNLYVIITTKSKIKHIKDIEDKDIDCIIILGAGIRGNNPSPMLEDRLLTGAALYKRNISNKII